MKASTQDLVIAAFIVSIVLLLITLFQALIQQVDDLSDENRALTDEVRMLRKELENN